MDYLDPTGLNAAWAGPLGSALAGAGLAGAQDVLAKDEWNKEHAGAGWKDGVQTYTEPREMTAGDYAKDIGIGAGAGVGTYYGSHLVGGVLAPVLGAAALPVAAVGLGAGLAYWNKKRLEADTGDERDPRVFNRKNRPAQWDPYGRPVGWEERPWYDVSYLWHDTEHGGTRTPEPRERPAADAPPAAPEQPVRRPAVAQTAPAPAPAPPLEKVAAPSPRRGAGMRRGDAEDKRWLDFTFGFGNRRPPRPGKFTLSMRPTHG